MGVYQYHGKQSLDKVTLPETIFRYITTKITTPIAGFEHKKDENGGFISLKEQLQQTHTQIILLVKNHYLKGASEKELIRIIEYFA